MRKLLLFIALAALLPIAAVADESARLAPAARPASIVLLDSGPYQLYQQMLQATARGLSEIGVIERGDVAVPSGTDDLEPMWQWLANHAGGRSLRFPVDGHYSLDWDTRSGAAVFDEIVERVKKRRDVDLVFCIGTTACRGLVERISSVPVIAYTSTNAVRAGIAASLEDSGRENVHAVVEPERFVRQMRIFYELFSFDRLGFVYPPRMANRYEVSAIADACKKLQVQFIGRPFDYTDNDPSGSFDRFFAQVKNLVEKDRVEAILLPFLPGTASTSRELARYLIEHKVFSYALSGSTPVRNGVLLGMDDSNINELGRFEAQVIEDVLAGKSPRSINQSYNPQRTVIVNLTTAMELGWQIPYDLLHTIGEVVKYHALD